MRKAPIVRLLLLLAVLSFSLMAAPPSGYALPSCPGLSCSDYILLCETYWGGEVSFSYQGQCQGFRDYYLGNCTTGASVQCAWY